MIRTHLSINPLRLDRERSYRNDLFKPNGLWYSNGNEWKDWSKNNLGRPYKHLYSLTHTAHVITIRNGFEMHDFQTQYGDHTYSQTGINWHKVAEDFDGIEILNYLQECRRMFDWYYPWDVGSGCIWNIKSVQLKRMNWKDTKFQHQPCTLHAV